MVKNLPAKAGETRDVALIPGSGRVPWRRKWQPIPVFLRKISWVEEPDGLQSMRLKKSRT